MPAGRGSAPKRGGGRIGEGEGEKLNGQNRGRGGIKLKTESMSSHDNQESCVSHQKQLSTKHASVKAHIILALRGVEGTVEALGHTPAPNFS